MRRSSHSLASLSLLFLSLSARHRLLTGPVVFLLSTAGVVTPPSRSQRATSSPFDLVLTPIEPPLRLSPTMSHLEETYSKTDVEKQGQQTVLFTNETNGAQELHRGCVPRSSPSRRPHARLADPLSLSLLLVPHTVSRAVMSR